MPCTLGNCSIHPPEPRNAIGRTSRAVAGRRAAAHNELSRRVNDSPSDTLHFEHKDFQAMPFKTHFLHAFVGFALVGCLPFQASHADDLIGDWSLQLDSGTPAWMSVNELGEAPKVTLRLHVGPDGPHKDIEYANGRLSFKLRQNKKQTDTKTVDVGVTDGKLNGVLTSTAKDGTVTQDKLTGKKIPPVPTTPPDLSKVQFAEPVSLFNGKDLTGWKAHEPDKLMGWSVKDGLLANDTPKTDFSATGAYANLRTTDVFEDFRLHIEFNIGEARNSGVYLRGMYEAQVVDRDSRMQGKQGVGAIFGLIEPSKNAGKKGGEWQTYDLTLVDRHVTVVLNGEKVIDNQPVAGPTGGAVHTDPLSPGPIHLQGDHTSVKYRNISLSRVIKN